LLASGLAKHEKDSPNGDHFLRDYSEASKGEKPLPDKEFLGNNPKDSFDEYVLFQRRIFKMTLVLTAFLGFGTIIFVDLNAFLSLCLGAFSGIIYLRLLAKSIGSLEKKSTSVSKVQLLIPVLLVLVVAKLPQLNLIPALVGFLLYKPSLIIQFMFQPSAST